MAGNRLFAGALLVLTLTLGAVPSPSVASTVPPTNITTPEILTATVLAAPSCMRWMVLGTCFWLSCSLCCTDRDPKRSVR